MSVFKVIDRKESKILSLYIPNLLNKEVILEDGDDPAQVAMKVLGKEVNRLLGDSFKIAGHIDIIRHEIRQAVANNTDEP